MKLHGKKDVLKDNKMESTNDVESVQEDMEGLI